jgi:hypothetical protein
VRLAALKFKAEYNRINNQRLGFQFANPHDDFIRRQQVALTNFYPPEVPTPARGLLPEFQEHGNHIPHSSLLNPLMYPFRAPQPHGSPGIIQPAASQAMHLDNALLPLIKSFVIANAFERVRVGEAPAQVSEMNGLKILGASAFTDKFTGASYLMKLEGQKKSSPGSQDNYFMPAAVKLIANINPRARCTCTALRLQHRMRALYARR